MVLVTRSHACLRVSSEVTVESPVVSHSIPISSHTWSHVAPNWPTRQAPPEGSSGGGGVGGGSGGDGGSDGGPPGGEEGSGAGVHAQMRCRFMSAASHETSSALAYALNGFGL